MKQFRCELVMSIEAEDKDQANFRAAEILARVHMPYFEAPSWYGGIDWMGADDGDIEEMGHPSDDICAHCGELMEDGACNNQGSPEHWPEEDRPLTRKEVAEVVTSLPPMSPAMAMALEVARRLGGA